MKVPRAFPPDNTFDGLRHWFIVHREDAAQLLLMVEQIRETHDKYVQTGQTWSRLETSYNWTALCVHDSIRRMLQADFELFFEREPWFREHNLPYRRGYLLWGSPGNGKTLAVRIMASHPHVRSFALDLSDAEEKNSNLYRLFSRAAENAPSLVILEDLDRAFPVEGTRTRERAISFQTLLNCLDG